MTVTAHPGPGVRADRATVSMTWPTTAPTRRWGLEPSHWALVLVCVGPAVAETALVLLLSPGSSPNLAPQVNAVVPFGVFHDLRWLSVYGSSWWTFGALAGGAIIARGALTALSVRLAWPRGTAAASDVEAVGARCGRHRSWPHYSWRRA